jgi:dolichol-phosphate mannosyltransferase
MFTSPRAMIKDVRRICAAPLRGRTARGVAQELGNAGVTGVSGSVDVPVAMKNAVVVIPTFNERDNIARIIGTVLDLYPDIHVLVVDDHSPDGTADAVRQLQSERPNLMLLERLSNWGFGPSYRDGFLKVLAEPWCEAVVTMDADLSHDPGEIRNLLDKLAGQDMVIGSRYTVGGSVKRWSRRRRMLSQAANLYVNIVLRATVQDTTSGFLCIRREALKSVLQKTASKGFAFMVELKYLLSRSGSRLAEHPIAFEDRREGESKMSAGKVWESLWRPWYLRLRYSPPTQRTTQPGVAGSQGFR